MYHVERETERERQRERERDRERERGFLPNNPGAYAVTRYVYQTVYMNGSGTLPQFLGNVANRVEVKKPRRPSQNLAQFNTLTSLLQCQGPQKTS